MVKIFIAVLFFSISISAQFHNKNFNQTTNKVRSEVFVSVISDSVHNVYFLFKFPYSCLVFEKKNSNFISKYEIALEIKNSKEQVVERKFHKAEIELNEYEKTISENEFITDFFEFELPEDTFSCKVTYTDLITGKPFDIFNQKIDLIRTNDLPRWLLLKHSNANKNNVFEIDIFGKIIPYSSVNYDLLIIGNNELSKLEKVRIKSEDTVLVLDEIVKLDRALPQLKSLNNKLLIEFKSDSEISDSINSSGKNKATALIVKNINQKLFEGKYLIGLQTNEGELIKEFPVLIQWIDKPKSLMDYDFALEMIEFIEVNQRYRTYFSSENEKKNKLMSYWKQKDPTPHTSFNELMNEFYSRVDFAQNEFISVSVKNGAITDRGRVFIINGKPEKIDRKVNSDGKVVESWYYQNPERIFRFIDFRGDGSFKILQ